MEDKLNALLGEVQAIKKQLEDAEPGWFKKTMHVVEALIVPLMLGAFAWLGTQAATSISKGQLDLSVSANEDRKTEARRSMQAKYIEIFYKDLNSGDPKSQLNAIRLVRLVDDELAHSLLDLVPATPGVSQAVVTKAVETKQQIEAVGPLRGYKVGIYYYGDDAPSKKAAEEVRTRITAAGFTGPLQLYPSDAAFFNYTNPPSGREVRYEAGLEDTQASTLLAIVKQPAPSETWQMRTVGSRTPNFVSIFIPHGG